MGLDIPANGTMQRFLQRMSAAGHEVAAMAAGTTTSMANTPRNQLTSEPLLGKNDAALGTVLGKPVRSYSAPMGNQPTWATRWLERTGHKAYYTVGDNGMGPTRSYFEGDRPQSRLWAMPVTNFGRIATFEELGDAPTAQQVAAFSEYLRDLVDHVASRRIARLFYFHPPAAPANDQAFEALLRSAPAQASQGRFAWYTMERLADFMTQRDETVWSITRQAPAGEVRVLHARRPAGLDDLSWVFPAGMARSATVVRGKATARLEGAHWVVVAGECSELVVRLA